MTDSTIGAGNTQDKLETIFQCQKVRKCSKTKTKTKKPHNNGSLPKRHGNRMKALPMAQTGIILGTT